MKQQGYVLVLTILMISISTVLLTAIIQNALNYQRLVRLAFDREQARALALSGIELALSQISLIEEPQQATAGGNQEKKEQQAGSEEKKDKAQSFEQRWLKQLLPIINTWQTISLTEATAGVTGTIRLYVSCEQGKINMRYLDQAIKADQEAEKKKVDQSQSQKPEARGENKTYGSVIDQLIKKELDVSIVQALKKIQTQLGRSIEDPTELRLNKNIFVSPDGKQKISIMDLFTTVDNSGKLNPWLFSRSLRVILGLTEKDQHKNGQDLISKFKPSMQWQKDWDEIFAPRYGKKFDSIPKEVSALFASQFEATAFSVVSYGQVGTITQKVSALLTEEEASTQSPSKGVTFKVAKLYWL
jgi:Tfp pilus assembly protein PilX